MPPLPCPELLEILKPAYQCPSSLNGNPCAGSKAEPIVKYCPKSGYIPRGYTGAFGSLKDIALILIIAEPGDPKKGKGENYEGCVSQEQFVSKVSYGVEGATKESGGKFHKGLRCILQKCWPDKDMDYILQRTWITDSVLCSAEKTMAPIQAEIESACFTHYLEKQLRCIGEDHPCFVGVLGAKARDRLKPHIAELPKNLEWGFYRSPAPPGGDSPKAKSSWDIFRDEFQSWKSKNSII